MNEWVDPTITYLFGFTISVIGFIFFDKRKLLTMLVIGSAIAIVGVAQLLHLMYYQLAGILGTVLISLPIYYYGLLNKGSSEHSDSPLDKYVDQKATVASELNPKGKIQVGEETLDATSEGLFIAKGTEVKVIRCSNTLLVVEKA